MPHRELSWEEFDRRTREGRKKLEKTKMEPPSIAPKYTPKDITINGERLEYKSWQQIDVDVYNIVEELAELLLSKHKDYGPTNISRAPGGALNGLRVRIHDKIARINNLIDSGKNPEHESLEDSFKDLANYAIISLMVTRGKWPEK